VIIGYFNSFEYMRRFFGLCIFFFFVGWAYTQELMIYSGLQNNLYFDFLNGNYYDSKASLNSFVGIQFDHDRTEKGGRVLFNLNYQKYNSYEEFIFGGYSSKIDSTHFDKSILKLDLQPVGFQFEENAFLNLGLGLEYRLSEVFATHRYTSSMNGTVTSIPFTDANSTYSRQVVPIICGTTGTQFQLYKNLNLRVQYQFSLGITPELKYGRAFKSFCILGISQSLAE
jgi:hypothetical protein